MLRILKLQSGDGEVTIMLFMFFVVVPLLGVIWFLNLITFMEKLHNDKNTHNQKVLGGVGPSP